MTFTPSQIAGGSYAAFTGIAIGVSQGWPAYRGAQSNRWPHVDGRITESNVVDYYLMLSRGGGPTWAPRVAYEYTVNGQLFTSTAIAYGKSYSLKRAVEYAARLHAGATIPVYYDPKAPSRAVLEPGANDMQLLFAGIGAAMVVIGALILAAGLGY
jgi:Protein of unknown function (DUF3592)